MIKTIRYLSFLATILSALVSCDKIDGPYRENIQPPVDTTACPAQTFPINPNPVRKVLLEDYTGHTCGNCPRAAETAHSLSDTYGDKLVVMGVHVGFFAKPSNSTTGKYTFDFRSTVGDDLNETFKNETIGLPNGMVNRKKVNDNIVLPHSSWSTAVNSIINLPPDADIMIKPSYSSVKNTICADVQVELLRNFTGNYNLCVYLVEDSIVNWQKDYSLTPPDIQYYTHRHVLRASLNTTWGEKIVDNTGLNGAKIIKRFSFVPDQSWNVSKCSIVAFLYDTESNEIVQAETKLIIP